MPNLSARIAENLAAVRGRIAEAAARSGRAADQIALVAVTKYVPADVARWWWKPAAASWARAARRRCGTKRPPWPICPSAGTWWATCSGTNCGARSRWWP